MTGEYRKFECEWAKEEIRKPAGLDELNEVRRTLKRLRLLGVGDDGVGFGNISMRSSRSGFLVSGSQTAHLGELAPEHVASVEDWSIERNWLRCRGLSIASSESLTHAAIYEGSPEAGGAIHVHSAALWKNLYDSASATPKEAEYGSVAIAKSLRELVRSGVAKPDLLVVMRGHEPGLMAFGPSLRHAMKTVVWAISAVFSNDD